MARTPAISWTDLFRSDAPSDFTLALRIVKKAGEPFLFVPASPALAACSLSLYPAQTRVAKLAKSLLRAAFQSRLPIPLERTSAALASREPFARFLASLVQVPSGSFPEMAILAGNPLAPGRRFLILLFSKNWPMFVVKAGVGDAARQLIRHEASFLHSAPSGTPGLPLLRASFDTGEVSAFALDFMAGDSPKAEAWPELGELLASWVNCEKQIRVCETRTWRALEPVCSADPLFTTLSLKLRDFSCNPAIFHGDFAPWNIKISSRSRAWNVLDWERGDLSGIPGWDWFHYVIQSGALVEKLLPEELSRRVENLLNHAAFRNYATLAKINGHERILVMSYLVHLIHSVRPSEGLETNQSLLSLLTQRWSI